MTQRSGADESVHVTHQRTARPQLATYLSKDAAGRVVQRENPHTLKKSLQKCLVTWTIARGIYSLI